MTKGEVWESTVVLTDNNSDLLALRLTMFLLIKEHKCFDLEALLD